MRFITIYLGIYFALVLGALIALWIGGVLPHLTALGVLVTLSVAVGLGLLTALVWRWNPHAVRRD